MWNKCSTVNEVDNQSVQYQVLSNSQCKKLYNAILEVLEHTGVEIFAQEGMDLLKKAGCYVDGNRVRIPSHLVEHAIATAPSRVVVCDRNGERRMFLEGKNTYFGPGPTNPNFYDLETGAYRNVLKSDVYDVAKLVEVLPNMDFVMSLACISDCTPGLADVHEVHAMLQNTIKPIVTWAYDVDNLDASIKMCEAVAGGAEALKENPFVVVYSEPTAPLRHSKEAVEIMLYMSEKGLPQLYTPGVQGCATAPGSKAGVLVITMADNLAGLVMNQLKNEGSPYILGGVTTNMDMKTMIHCYGSSPEFSLMHAAANDFIHFLNLPGWSTAGCADSKILDEQAAIEYTMSLYTAALSGSNLVHDCGFLETGLAGSLQALVMSDEIIGMVRNAVKGINIDDESLAVDVINKVGPGGNFLAEDHTFKNFKKEFWTPRDINREIRHNWIKKGETTYGQRLTARAKQLLTESQIQTLPADVLKQLQVILDQAEAHKA